jgi:NADH dehydrogenase
MILVVGATGHLGGLITASLRARHASVRILARPGSAPQSLRDAGVQVAIGDLKSRPTLDAACDGVDVVITTANSALRGGADNVVTVDIEGNRHLIDAARSATVRQFVFVSALGVTTDSPVPLFRAKALTEMHLRESGLPYTILAPDAFMDVWFPMVIGPALSGAPVTLVGQGLRKHSFIAAADVAAFATASVGRADALNRHLPLGGPDAVSWREVIGAFERALSREIPIVSVAPGQPLPGVPDIVATLMAGLDTYDSVVPMSETAQRFGVQQTPVDDFVVGMLAGLNRP